ncbi:MAG: 2-hydroxychromene-2-carboxylate isomerase [Myxococcota bacterium]
MSDTVEFFFDISSPYSYLAATQVDDLVERTGADVAWKPFLLGGVFKMTGNQMPAAVRAKASYMLEDLHRWAEYYDVPFVMNSHFPVNSLYAQRALLAARERKPGSLQPFARALFDACWVQDRDISQTSEVAVIADSCGLDGEAILADIQHDRLKDELKSLTSEAVDRGAFGAPTFFVGEQMFWGNDRLHFVEEALQ